VDQEEETESGWVDQENFQLLLYICVDKEAWSRVGWTRKTSSYFYIYVWIRMLESIVDSFVDQPSETNTSDEP
jgi:hypothetical protein